MAREVSIVGVVTRIRHLDGRSHDTSAVVSAPSTIFVKSSSAGPR